MSDHSTHLLKLHNYIAPTQQFTSSYVRNINSFTVDGFQSKFNTKIWEGIFEGFDENVTFSNILNTCLNFLCTFY